VTSSTLANWEKDAPHGLGREVLQGVYNAVFDPKDEGADRSARIDRIAAELRLGLGAMLCYRLLDLTSQSKSGAATAARGGHR
jgi:hypothetical protein